MGCSLIEEESSRTREAGDKNSRLRGTYERQNSQTRDGNRDLWSDGSPEGMKA